MLLYANMDIPKLNRIDLGFYNISHVLNYKQRPTDNNAIVSVRTNLKLI